MSRALIAITAERRGRAAGLAGGRANADFIAHLIATRARAPQTRLRRRAEPGEAIAAYRLLGQWPTETGRALSESL